MGTNAADQAETLKTVARSSAALMAVLEACRSLELAFWCVGAGAVRNLVWDHLHGKAPSSSIPEVDLVYFDSKAPPEQERHIQGRLLQAHPGVSWDVTNQAHVHLWYERAFGTPVAPLCSVEEGVASWPEYATCIALCLTGRGELEVVAPYGLADLFALRVRHNPARASPAVFGSRHTSKGWLQRWPKLELVPA